VHKDNFCYIPKIYRVQNPFLWKLFQDKEEELTRLYRRHGQKIQPAFLFHGTSPEAVKNICENGFDWRRNGESVGTKYGMGTYFSNKASFSHDYCKNDFHATRMMFMAKVLVGLVFKGNKDTRYPPAWKWGLTYDTAVNDEKNPVEFVKFDFHECYPAYLIQYAV
jgi:hypothetical protein